MTDLRQATFSEIYQKELENDPEQQTFDDSVKCCVCGEPAEYFYTYNGKYYCVDCLLDKLEKDLVITGVDDD